jgi:hypothetical protein
MIKQKAAAAMEIVLVAAMTLTAAQNVFAADCQSPAKPNIVVMLSDDIPFRRKTSAQVQSIQFLNRETSSVTTAGFTRRLKTHPVACN